jgi:hypothetical protein
MESSSLFNPDFTGSAFRWWIGQIPDDSYWRDNITPTKYDDPSSPTGWGYRYKVKIIGLHDPDTESIETDQLPWANVMYPVTAGGGQQSSFQTPNIRQGMFVFGFFLDGSDMQVPIIMGVLGNNSKTELAGASSHPRFFRGIKGIFEGNIPTERNYPDFNLALVERDQPAIESSDATQASSAGQAILQETICEKIPLKTPENDVQSSIKNMRTEIETLTGKISKYMNSITSYADAVSFRGQNPQILIKDASKVLAKYTKPIMDQMMAHTQKKLNEELTKVVSALPSSERYLFAEMKEEMNEMALCLYGKLTNNLSNKLEGLLLDALDIDNLIEQARRNRSDGKDNPFGDGTTPKTPDVPVCAAEQIMADVIISNIGEIQENNDNMIQGVNEFLKDISDKVAGVLSIADQVSKGLGILGALSQLGNINTSMAAAMLFNNLSLDIFGCELKPNEAVSDEYAFCSGGSGQKDVDLSTAPDQGGATGDSDGRPDVPPTPGDPSFAQPVGGEEEDTEDLNNATVVDDQTPITQESIPLTVEPFVDELEEVPLDEIPSAQGFTSDDRTRVLAPGSIPANQIQVSGSDGAVRGGSSTGRILNDEQAVAQLRKDLAASEARDARQGRAEDSLRTKSLRRNLKTFEFRLENAAASQSLRRQQGQ